MTASPHLLLALSGHGYGHLAQCAPVINALWAGLPDMRLSVCTSLPREVIAARLDKPFTCHAVELDPMLPMFNAWEVDVTAAERVYRDFHTDWDAGIQRDVDLLASIKPDLLLADVPYRILLAARESGIPAVALCSLNWASIYASYLGGRPGSGNIVEQMLSGYRAADIFLAPEPALPMPDIENYQPIGPIARVGSNCRPELQERFSLQPGTTLVLVALGGIATGLPLENWPQRDNTVWLFAEAVTSSREDIINCESFDWPLIDVLASVDAVITKPGYGTYTEAVCNAVPLLTLARPDWPETVCLNAWASRYGRHEDISREQFYAGEFVEVLERLLSKPAPLTLPEPTGNQQAAEVLKNMFV